MLFKSIEDIIHRLDENSISDQRKAVLNPILQYLQSKVDHNQSISLNFICTHNSRRSHLSQVWAQALAYYYKVQNVYCYSGGTESTALFPAAAQSLSEAGFRVEVLSKTPNPIYSIKFAPNAPSVIGFSKTYDHSFNPLSKFVAVLTCTSADQGCPFIAGAELRVSVPFEDPKVFDGTSLQSEKYNERSLQIATELKYVFASIKL